MKKLLLLTVLLSVLVSCGGRQQIEKQLHSGNYDVAITNALKKLKNNKDKKRKEEHRNFPLFVGEIDGETVYVIPVIGKGLWGPIWGNVCIDSDMNTIRGASFGHKGETPGLGSNIKERFFMDDFKGEHIMDNNYVVRHCESKELTTKEFIAEYLVVYFQNKGGVVYKVFCNPARSQMR